MEQAQEPIQQQQDTSALDLERLADMVALRLRPESDRLLTLTQLAERLQLSPRGVCGLIERGELPTGLIIGGSRRWSWKQVEVWLTTRSERARAPKKTRRGRPRGTGFPGGKKGEQP